MSRAAALDLVFLWHMHQPDYRDRQSGEFVLPWTYLHAIKDYSDMANHLERHPRIRAVVNFVPVLVEQLQDYVDQFATGQWRDPLLRLLGQPQVQGFDADSRRYLLEACFRCNHPTMLTPFPKYRRLYDWYRQLQEQGGTALNYLSSAYFTDLLTWYHLAWFGETERRRRPLVAELMAKGEGFSDAERAALRQQIGEVLSTLLPRYRALAEAGQIELSATPHSHPLAPLLLDFHSAQEAMPEIKLPQWAAYPGGRHRVEYHIRRGRQAHADQFGQAPIGMWPAEGAVSDKLLPLLERAGCRWIATSEEVLANSLSQGMDGGLPERSHWLYRPYRFAAAPELNVFFRDEKLSDQIGFEYARWHGRDAARHFVLQLEAILEKAPDDGPAPLVSIMLDGENAWEHYPYNGFYFFDDLYTLLEGHAGIRSTTFKDYLDQPEIRPGNLPRLFAGSWVHGNFSTWIGDPAKNRAWELLCAAKQAYDLVTGSERLTPEEKHRAEEQLAICESSDWFWWFGDYNPAASVQSFDRLYRDNLTRLYRLLKMSPPVVLEEAISRGGGQAEGGGTMRRAGV